MFSAVIYYFKFFIFMLVEVGLMTISMPFMLFRFRKSQNGIFTALGVSLILKLIGVDIKIEGKENINKSEPAVIVANHQTMIDLGVCKALLLTYGNLSCMMKASTFLVPTFGFAAYLCDTIFVSRSKDNWIFSPQKAVLRCVKLLTVKKRNVCIFPEGTRLNGQKLGPFRKGAFEIAIKANVKVQPIVIQNYAFIDHENKFFGRGQLKVKILPPIEAIRDESADGFSRRVRELMSFEFQNINES